LCFDNEDSAVIDDIVCLGKSMGLEVNNEVGLKQSRVVPRDRKKKKNPLPNNNISYFQFFTVHIVNIHNNHQQMHTFSFDTIKL